jgi:hypothetical protein
MPAAVITESSSILVPAGRRRGFILQNLNSFPIYVRWDGGTNVTAAAGDDAGILIGAGGSLTVTEAQNQRMGDAPIVGVSEPAQGTGEIRYLLF